MTLKTPGKETGLLSVLLSFPRTTHEAFTRTTDPEGGRGRDVVVFQYRNTVTLSNVSGTDRSHEVS